MVNSLEVRNNLDNLQLLEYRVNARVGRMSFKNSSGREVDVKLKRSEELARVAPLDKYCDLMLPIFLVEANEKEFPECVGGWEEVKNGRAEYKFIIDFQVKRVEIPEPFLIQVNSGRPFATNVLNELPIVAKGYDLYKRRCPRALVLFPNLKSQVQGQNSEPVEIGGFVLYGKE